MMQKVMTYLITILTLLVVGSFGLASCQAAAAQNNIARAAKIEAIGHAILNAFSGLGLALLSTVPIIAIVAIVAGMVILGVCALKFRAQFAPPQVQVIERKTVLLLPEGTHRRQLYQDYGSEIAIGYSDLIDKGHVSVRER